MTETTPTHPALLAWLSRLSPASRSNYLRAVDLLGQHTGLEVDGAAELVTAGDPVEAAAAIRALVDALHESKLAVSTARCRLSALDSLAKSAGRDLGVQGRRGGWRPRRTVEPSEGRARRAATLPAAEGATTALEAWAPHLRRAADQRGLTVSGLLAEALRVLAAERSGPGFRLAGWAAVELEILAGDLAPLSRRARVPTAPKTEQPADPKATLESELAAQEAELQDLERRAQENAAG